MPAHHRIARLGDPARDHWLPLCRAFSSGRQSWLAAKRPLEAIQAWTRLLVLGIVGTFLALVPGQLLLAQAWIPSRQVGRSARIAARRPLCALVMVTAASCRAASSGRRGRIALWADARPREPRLSL